MDEIILNPGWLVEDMKKAKARLEPAQYGPYQNARSRRRTKRIFVQDDAKALEGLRISYKKKRRQISELEREIVRLERELENALSTIEYYNDIYKQG